MRVRIIKLCLILGCLALSMLYMNTTIKSFKDVFSSPTLTKVLFLSFLNFLLYKMIELVLITKFSENKRRYRKSSKSDDSRLGDDDEEDLDALRKYVIKKDKENDKHHIVLGDYDSDVEEKSDHKIINIDNGSSFLIPFSKAYKEKKEITIILETVGGSVQSSDMIFRSLLEYPYGVVVYVINYAFSAGTFISLACEKIFMTPWALLGPTDPQITCDPDNSDFEASSRLYMEMMDSKRNKTLSERMFMTSKEAKLFHDENITYINEALQKRGYEDEVIGRVTDELCSGKYSHGKPFNKRMLIGLGLQIEDDVPDYIHNIGNKARRFKS